MITERISAMLSCSTTPASASAQPPRIACIILASGFARRFNENKLLALYQGAPLICSLFSSLPRSAFAKILTVTRYPEILDLAAQAEIEVLLHDQPLLSDTIRLGILEADKSGPYDGYMLCVADQPLLSADTFITLVSAFAQCPDHIIRPVYQGTPGNPVIFPAQFREELLALEGDNGGRVVIRSHLDAVYLQEIADPREFFDIDTQENLSELQKL